MRFYFQGLLLYNRGIGGLCGIGDLYSYIIGKTLENTGALSFLYQSAADLRIMGTEERRTSGSDVQVGSGRMGTMPELGRTMSDIISGLQRTKIKKIVQRT